MGRRRRTKVQMRPKPKIPTIFDCPVCSKKTVSVTLEKGNNLFDFTCTNCGKKYHYSNPTHIPVSFSCPSCKQRTVSIEFIDATNSIRIFCENCNKAVSASAKQWQKDPETFSVVELIPGGSKLGCPECNFRTINLVVKLRQEVAYIQCGACGISDSYLVTPLDEKVDVYGKFIDTIRSDPNAIERLRTREPPKLKEPVKKPKAAISAPQIQKKGISKTVEEETEELFKEEEEEVEGLSKEEELAEAEEDAVHEIEHEKEEFAEEEKEEEVEEGEELKGEEETAPEEKEEAEKAGEEKWTDKWED